MKHTRGAFLVLVLTLASTTGALRAATITPEPQEAGGLEHKQQMTLQSTLREAARKWYRERQKLMRNCRRCEGEGTITVLVKGQIRRDPCKSCGETGLIFNDDCLKRVLEHYDQTCKSFPGMSNGRPDESEVKKMMTQGREGAQRAARTIGFVADRYVKSERPRVWQTKGAIYGSIQSSATPERSYWKYDGRRWLVVDSAPEVPDGDEKNAAESSAEEGSREDDDAPTGKLAFRASDDRRIVFGEKVDAETRRAWTKKLENLETLLGGLSTGFTRGRLELRPLPEFEIEEPVLILLVDFGAKAPTPQPRRRRGGLERMSRDLVVAAGREMCAEDWPKDLPRLAIGPTPTYIDENGQLQNRLESLTLVDRTVAKELNFELLTNDSVFGRFRTHRPAIPENLTVWFGEKR
ncbi:MAG: hypothetical protein R3F20_16995 [Planctomycetota bacterium]